MYLKNLQISHFRNIQHADLPLNKNLNIIFGKNGSGKTSFLESVSLVSQAKSFRSHLSSPLITDGEVQTTVFAQAFQDCHQSLSIGVEKHKSKGSRVRVNRETLSSNAQLARYLPSICLDGSSFSFVDGSSKYRRSLLDWFVFHVEHEFHSVWKRFLVSIKQRNASLRRGIITDHSLAGWTRELAESGETISSMRARLFEVIGLEFEDLKVSAQVDTTILFSKGWKDEEALADCLAKNLEGDVNQQTTRHGPHRSDLVLTTANGRKAADIYSRGQKKKLIAVFYLALIKAYKKHNQASILVLLDDLVAELDRDTVRFLIKEFLSLNNQVFITVIEPDTLLPLLPKDTDFNLFHVEQGKIDLVPNNN